MRALPGSRTEDELSHLLSGLFLHVREHVGVRVEREGDIRVTEALTHDLGGDAG
jgi:RNA:NAD 2'-phosphotransferase (TPT1/KptA family)